MTVWRTQFERIDFDFDPPLKQTADVVFETDVPFEDEHLEEFDTVAWQAMWKQNPQWKNSEPPLEGYSGWSSVLGGHKFEEVKDVDLDFDLGVPGEGKPRLCELFEHKDYKYRVEGFYKTWKSKPNNLLDSIKERRGNDSIQLTQCTREEAEFVNGVGVGGCIIRIQDVNITGLVGWEVRTIARHRRDYKVHDSWPIEIHKYWD